MQKYETPQLTEYGEVHSLTFAYGVNGADDFVFSDLDGDGEFDAGEPTAPTPNLPGYSGSQPGCLSPGGVPCTTN